MAGGLSLPVYPHRVGYVPLLERVVPEHHAEIQALELAHHVLYIVGLVLLDELQDLVVCRVPDEGAPALVVAQGAQIQALLEPRLVADLNPRRVPLGVPLAVTLQVSILAPISVPRPVTRINTNFLADDQAQQIPAGVSLHIADVTSLRDLLQSIFFEVCQFLCQGPVALVQHRVLLV